MERPCAESSFSGRGVDGETGERQKAVLRFDARIRTASAASVQMPEYGKSAGPSW